MRMDHRGISAHDQLWMAIEVQGEIERCPAGRASKGNRMIATAGNGRNVDVASGKCGAHARENNALSPFRWRVVVTDEGDADRHFWQVPQNTVVRPHTTTW